MVICLEQDAFKSRLFSPFWYRLTEVVLEKRLSNMYVFVCVLRKLLTHLSRNLLCLLVRNRELAYTALLSDGEIVDVVSWLRPAGMLLQWSQCTVQCVNAKLCIPMKMTLSPEVVSHSSHNCPHNLLDVCNFVHLCFYCINYFASAVVATEFNQLIERVYGQLMPARVCS